MSGRSDPGNTDPGHCHHRRRWWRCGTQRTMEMGPQRRRLATTRHDYRWSSSGGAPPLLEGCTPA
ncbi:UNVERIFIED_CONTAM: hypothetical protein Sangu_1808900 [Sesamum angustifolium]|uniref:Uncharacterized protein n=1 Tax=Sesamum angustifolium TaxID=2727405 RepID=A0AAW2M8Q8_9LAMI